MDYIKAYSELEQKIKNAQREIIGLNDEKDILIKSIEIQEMQLSKLKSRRLGIDDKIDKEKSTLINLENQRPLLLQKKIQQEEENEKAAARETKREKYFKMKSELEKMRVEIEG